MAKKKGGMQSTVFQWAYQNRKTGTKAADVLKSIEEVEKALDGMKIKKK